MAETGCTAWGVATSSASGKAFLAPLLPFPWSSALPCSAQITMYSQHFCFGADSDLTHCFVWRMSCGPTLADNPCKQPLKCPGCCAMCLVTQSCPILWDPMDCRLPGSSVHGDSPGKNTGMGYHAFLPGIFPTQGLNPGLLPALQEDSLSSEPQEKPKNTGVGSLSLLQGIFLTQELNWGLLNCRWILYQLSYQGSLSWVLLLPKSTAFMLAPLE